MLTEVMSSGLRSARKRRSTAASSAPRPVERAALLDDTVHESPGERPLGHDQVAGVKQLLGARRTDQPYEAHAAVAREASQARLGEAQFHVFLAHPKVARQRELETAA